MKIICIQKYFIGHEPKLDLLPIYHAFSIRSILLHFKLDKPLSVEEYISTVLILMKHHFQKSLLKSRIFYWVDNFFWYELTAVKINIMCNVIISKYFRVYSIKMVK